MEGQQKMMAIHRAIKNGQLLNVAGLIGNDQSLLSMITPFGTWLHDAASHGQLEIARWLIQRGIDVNRYTESTERRPLDEAAAEGHLEIAILLLDSGATLDVSDSVRNPLFSAIIGGDSDSHTEIARLLVSRGIDTSVKYSGGGMSDMDALAFAKEWGRSRIVTLLMSE